MLLLALAFVLLQGPLLDVRPDPCERTLRTTFVGRVVGCDGRPLAATVTTSAGGSTACAADGSFALAADVPLDAEYVEVGAEVLCGSELLTAGLRVLPAALAQTTAVGTLALVLQPGCRERWLPALGAAPGTDAAVQALFAFDDGNGPALVLGGGFATAGSVEARGVARWDGARWSALGAGLGDVRALAAFDDGGGPMLIAGGGFTVAAGAAADRIARWSGTAWSPLGAGVGGSVVAAVEALTVFDDGGGPALYAAGSFTTAGGAAANRIARWDGASWSPLASGVNAPVHALAVFDDGGGPALYAGGDFTTAGGAPASQIARWDGAAWTALGSGIVGQVYSLTVFDGGGGPQLIAGGIFTSAGGTAANHVAAWDGTSWSALGTGMAGGFTTVLALAVLDGGDGPVLCAGGRFHTAGDVDANRLARWDGSAWAALGGGTTGTDPWVYALATFDDGGGPRLYAGGEFDTVDFRAVNHVARWDGVGWSALDRGLDDRVCALAVHDDGAGPALYLGGEFRTADGATRTRIARFDGERTSALGSGIDGTVFALAAFDDGGGPALYAGGEFTTAGGDAASRIARWDGASWSALAGGIGTGTSRVTALATYDGGPGPALYAGGAFTSAGGTPALALARWDGAGWSALGSGLAGVVVSVNALATFDDGTGNALYVGGTFDTAGGVTAQHIARWDGTSWSAVGTGLPGTSTRVTALAVFDDGNGAALYAAGTIASSLRIARWDGASWTIVGSFPGGGFIAALAAFDGGTGPALYAGGFFATVDGVAARNVARWDGTSWSALGSGTYREVLAFAPFDAGTGARLYMGGDFDVSPSHASFLACFGCAEKVARQR